MEKRFPVLLFLFLLFESFGCASGPALSSNNEPARLLMPPPDQSILIIYRNENAGSGIPIILYLDDIKLGEIPIKSYYRLVIAPGRHLIRSRSDNESVSEIVAEKGKAYFVHEKVDMGFTRNYSELVQVSEEVGSAGIRGCQQLNIR